MCMLSVLIVHYNMADLLRRSLTALFSDPPEVSFEVPPGRFSMNKDILTYFKEMQLVTVTFKRWLGSNL